MKVKHLNLETCLKCESIIDKYPGFHKELKEWALDFRKRNPEAHISYAGRSKEEQELFYKKGLSRAQYGQSAHSYNAAIDWFRLTLAGQASFDTSWYKTVLGPAVMKEDWLTWYGAPGSKFFEYAHVQVKAWKDLVSSGLLKLVE